jgi:DtxR family transcriptional regulator, Mn-dependent transcriptional regulator
MGIRDSEGKMTESLEDYLEEIYLQVTHGQVARVTTIADKLGVSKPSVNNALKELEKRGLIVHQKYGYIQLTDEGKRVSESVSQKHVLIKKLLVTVFGVSEPTAEADACRIEHDVSEETFSHITDFLAAYKPPRKPKTNA